MSDDVQTEVVEEVVEQPTLPEMPYYMTQEFHEKLQSVPFAQEVNGERIVNVNYKFFKALNGVLVEAIVPKDLSIPSEWVSAENDPLAAKAKSMLNLA
jgi:hypothetical protein